MADGLLGGLLPYIYSRADAVKRTLGDIVANPTASAEQAIGNINDRSRNLNQLHAITASQGIAGLRSPEGQRLMNIYTEAYNPTGMMIGKSAKGMQELINQAELLAQQGVPDYKITEITGLERVPMGQGRMPEWGKQISDVGVLIKQDTLQRLKTPLDKQIIARQQTPVENITIGDLLDHPEFFNAYPELKNIPAEKVSGLMFGTQAYYDPKNNVIGLSGLNPYMMDKVDKQLVDITSSLLHELQHAVQTIENFPRGGNTVEFMKKSTSKIEKKLREVDKNFVEKIKNTTGLDVNPYDLKAIVEYGQDKNRYLTDKQRQLYENPDMAQVFQSYLRYQGLRDRISSREKEVLSNYRALAGEAQARATQKQYETGKMTVPMTESYDVPVESLIYRDPFGNTTR